MLNQIDRKRFFDDIAQCWEKEHKLNRERERLKKLVKYFPLVRGDRVLDVGCGTGRLVPFLREVIEKEGFLIESDFSRKMLKIGKCKYKQKNLCFIQADAQMIPLKKEFFDVIICFSLFPHLPHKTRALMEFHRILKPGRPLVIAHLMSRDELNRFHSQVKGPVTQDILPVKEEMKELFSSAGFHSLTIKDEPSLYIAQAAA